MSRVNRIILYLPNSECEHVKAKRLQSHGEEIASAIELASEQLVTFVVPSLCSIIDDGHRELLFFFALEFDPVAIDDGAYTDVSAQIECVAEKLAAASVRISALSMEGGC